MPLPLFTRQIDDPTAHTPTIYDADAATVNEMMDELEPIAAATAHARYANVQTLSADKTLTDADLPIQSLYPNGATRNITLAAAAATNHATYFWNRAAAIYNLVIKDASANVIATINPGSGSWVLPDGSTGWIQMGGRGSLSAEMILTNDNATLIAGTNFAHFKYIVTAEMAGKKITAMPFHVTSPSSSGLPTFNAVNSRYGVNILSTPATIDVGESDSILATTPAVIDAAHADLQEGDEIRFDCSVTGTGTKGVSVRMSIQ